MRLIDADALLSNKFKNAISYNAFANLVKRQPTVEERKVGKWIVSTMPVTGAIEIKCSECDTPYYMAFTLLMNYCPNCGAKMERRSDG